MRVLAQEVGESRSIPFVKITVLKQKPLQGYREVPHALGCSTGVCMDILQSEQHDNSMGISLISRPTNVHKGLGTRV